MPFCASSRRFRDDLTFTNRWSWKHRSRPRCRTFVVAPYDGKYLTSYLMAIVISTLSVTSYHIFTNLIKHQKFTLKMKVKVKKEKNETSAVSLALFDSILLNFLRFFLVFEQHVRLHKLGYTFKHTYTHTHARVHERTRAHTTRTHTRHTHIRTHKAGDADLDQRRNLQWIADLPTTAKMSPRQFCSIIYRFYSVTESCAENADIVSNAYGGLSQNGPGTNRRT